MALAVVSLVLTVILATSITRGIRRPVQELEIAAAEMAKGSLQVAVTYESKVSVAGSDVPTGICGRCACFGSIISHMLNLIGNFADGCHQLLEEMAQGNFDVRTRAEASYTGDYAPLLQSPVHTVR